MKEKQKSGGAGTFATGDHPSPEVVEIEVPGKIYVREGGRSVVLTTIEIPEFIRQYRLARGWTQERLAAECGYTDAPRALISDIETGRRHLGLKTLGILFSALGGNVEIGFFTEE